MKRLIIKDVNATGDSRHEFNSEDEVRNDPKLKEDKTTIMVLPDGRTCNTIDELLALIQEDVYKESEEIMVYRLPVLVGG